jgi:hypothetical protein
MDLFYHPKEANASPMSSTHAFFSKSIEDVEEIKNEPGASSGASSQEDLSEQV